MDLWLFRPADTEWDAAQRLRGNVDLPATEESLAELRQRVARLSDGPELLFHAPDECAAESSRVIASRFGCAISAVPALASPDFGLLQGLSLAEPARPAGNERHLALEPATVRVEDVNLVLPLASGL
jgi:broad specificity phosphatase PhoE